MFTGILEWLLGFLLKWLLGKLGSFASKKVEEARVQAEREGTDAENIKKYEEAQTRAERIKHATDLLNGVRGS